MTRLDWRRANGGVPRAYGVIDVGRPTRSPSPRVHKIGVTRDVQFVIGGGALRLGPSDTPLVNANQWLRTTAVVLLGGAWERPGITTYPKQWPSGWESWWVRRDDETFWVEWRPGVHGDVRRLPAALVRELCPLAASLERILEAMEFGGVQADIANDTPMKWFRRHFDQLAEAPQMVCREATADWEAWLKRGDGDAPIFE